MKKLVIRILLIDLSVGLLLQQAAIRSSAKGTFCGDGHEDMSGTLKVVE